MIMILKYVISSNLYYWCSQRNKFSDPVYATLYNTEEEAINAANEVLLKNEISFVEIKKVYGTWGKHPF